MSKELATRPQATVAGFSNEQVDILRKTLFKKFTDDEIQFSLAVCNRTGLDPFVRQIHFTKRSNNKTKEDTIVITTGIDGFRLTANRSHAYAGSEEPAFEVNAKGLPVKATVSVYKMVQGIRCAFTASARWDEFYPGDGPDGFMWRKMPFTMISKCAEAQALRKAFPAELSNIYAHEEMAQASNDKTMIATKAAEVNKLLEASDSLPDLEVEHTRVEEPEAVTVEQRQSLGDYIIPIGQKNKGKKLSELTRSHLTDFLNWVKTNISNKNAATLEFIAAAEAYLETVK